ncbi:MAG: DUF86 domain-containing protein [Candidatus Nanohaloarchaea archaeon]|nr:DUF86 domain-containing protein [Candidatus Nanohaloarchaea archaeon]
MQTRLKDKIEEISTYLEELEQIKPKNFRSYQEDLQQKAACERYFEKIVEASTDLAFLIIRDKDLERPKDDKNSFDILEQNEIISSNLSEKLKEAKGMRNILAHEYGEVDDRVVFESITDELEEDVTNFLSQIEENVIKPQSKEKDN